MSESSIKQMGQNNCVAVLLPVSNYFIKESKKPPIELFRKHMVDIAIATNCNPGSSPCCSILLAMNMACTLFGLTVKEALDSVTINAAKVLGIEKTHGSINVGKVADLVLWDVETINEIPYYLGLNKLKLVVKNGSVVAM